MDSIASAVADRPHLAGGDPGDECDSSPARQFARDLGTFTGELGSDNGVYERMVAFNKRAEELSLEAPFDEDLIAAAKLVSERFSAVL